MRSPSLRDRLVRSTRPASVTGGPDPHGSENVAAGASVAGRKPRSAGMDSFDSPTGSRTGRPEIGCAMVANWTTGKLIVICLVFNGGTSSVRPPSPTLAYLIPCGLVILIASGAAAKPGSGCSDSRLIVRLPGQLSVHAAGRPPPIHGPRGSLLNKFAGARPGSDPSVEPAVTSRVL